MKEFFSLYSKNAKDIGVSKISVVIAYYVLLSLFPLLITVGTVLPFFHINPEIIEPYLSGVVPRAILDALKPGITGLLTRQNGGLLSLGIMFTVWSAGKGMHFIRDGISRAYGITHGYFLAARMTSSVILILLTCLLALVLALFSFGEALITGMVTALNKAGSATSYFRMLKWPVTFAVLFLVILFLYLTSLNVEMRVRDVAPGALITTAGMLVMTSLFSLYISFFARSFTAYGVIGAIFMLMIWLRALGYLLLMGAVINAVTYIRKGLPLIKKHGRVSRAIEGAYIKLLKCVERVIR